MAQTYSIREQFAGATVFITGASGYIGSLVLEQLLRTTDVARVYVLIRGKAGATAQDRIAKLLHSGLFHLVRDRPELLRKVRAVEGDMDRDGLGLSPKDAAVLASSVNVVVHSAAAIVLEADVHSTLSSNYVGTRRLLDLAKDMERLRCFVHVSSAYVNVHFPKNSTVDERIFPLAIGTQEVDHREVVEDLLSLEPAAANVRAQMYLDMWGFPNTYTLGKNLSEKMVDDYCRAGMPVAIVRPSLTTGLAGAPYPGFCGNLAGPVGMGLALAIGLFSTQDSVGLVPTNVWDAVPGDVVSSCIIAAAAAVSAGARIDGYAAARGAGAPGSSGGSAAAAREPLIVHAATSTTYPISMAEAAAAAMPFVEANPPPFRLPGRRVTRVKMDHVPDEQALRRAKYWTAWKVWAAVRLLEALGQVKTARRLKYGHAAWEVMNSPKTDRNVFFSSRNLLQLEAALDRTDAASGDFLITWTRESSKGGWPRYVATNLAGLWRNVFGVSDVKGLKHNDFAYIPSKPVPPSPCGGAAPAEGEGPAPEQQQWREGGAGEARAAGGELRAAGEASCSSSSGSSEHTHDLVQSSLKASTAALWAVPAAGADAAADGTACVQVGRGQSGKLQSIFSRPIELVMSLSTPATGEL